MLRVTNAAIIRYSLLMLVDTWYTETITPPVYDCWMFNLLVFKYNSQCTNLNVKEAILILKCHFAELHVLQLESNILSRKSCLFYNNNNLFNYSYLHNSFNKFIIRFWVLMKLVHLTRVLLFCCRCATCYYLLPLATSCYFLYYIPITTFYYLLLYVTHYLSPPATTCYYLSLSVTTCYYLLLPTTSCYLLYYIPVTTCYYMSLPVPSCYY